MTPEQRKAAVSFLATCSDEAIASFVWQAAAADECGPEIAEVAAMHCDNVVAHSEISMASDNPEVADRAAGNFASYKQWAIKFRSGAKQES